MKELANSFYLLKKKYKDIIIPSDLITDTISLYLIFLGMFLRSYGYTKAFTCNSCDYEGESTNFHLKHQVGDTYTLQLK